MPEHSIRFAAALVLFLTPHLCWPEETRAEPRAFVIDPSRSRIVIHVGKAGLFSFAGHEHEVVAPVREGEVVANSSDLAHSSVRLVFDAATLRLERTSEGPGDVAKIQETMAGSAVLDVVRFAQVIFQSDQVRGREISAGDFELVVGGLIEIRGHQERLPLSVRAKIVGNALVATGKAVLRQSSYGIAPISVAGLVKVKDELAVDFRIEARLRP